MATAWSHMSILTPYTYCVLCAFMCVCIGCQKVWCILLHGAVCLFSHPTHTAYCAQSCVTWMYLSIYIYIYVCIHTCVYIYICTCIYTYVYVRIHMCVCVHTNRFNKYQILFEKRPEIVSKLRRVLPIRTYIHTHIYIYICICIYIYIYPCTYKYTLNMYIMLD